MIEEKLRTVDAVIVAADLVTAYGRGIDAAWRGIHSGRTALAFSDRISFPGGTAKTPLGLVPDVDARSGSAVLQMLAPMLPPLLPQLPENTLLLPCGCARGASGMRRKCAHYLERGIWRILTWRDWKARGKSFAGGMRRACA